MASHYHQKRKKRAQKKTVDGTPKTEHQRRSIDEFAQLCSTQLTCSRVTGASVLKLCRCSCCSCCFDVGCVQNPVPTPTEENRGCNARVRRRGTVSESRR